MIEWFGLKVGKGFLIQDIWRIIWLEVSLFGSRGSSLVGAGSTVFEEGIL